MRETQIHWGLRMGASGKFFWCAGNLVEALRSAKRWKRNTTQERTCSKSEQPEVSDSILGSRLQCEIYRGHSGMKQEIKLQKDGRPHFFVTLFVITIQKGIYIQSIPRMGRSTVTLHRIQKLMSKGSCISPYRTSSYHESISWGPGQCPLYSFQYSLSSPWFSRCAASKIF